MTSASSELPAALLVDALVKWAPSGAHVLVADSTARQKAEPCAALDSLGLHAERLHREALAGRPGEFTGLDGIFDAAALDLRSSSGGTPSVEDVWSAAVRRERQKLLFAAARTVKPQTGVVVLVVSADPNEWPEQAYAAKRSF